jgi:GT2 family glycosyltransferase
VTLAVGAVVVSFNSADDLPGCLDALSASSAAGPVVVVDNASADGSADIARRYNARGIDLLALDVNTGFAGGCNRGLAALRDGPEVVAFVNPDVRVAPDCLQRAAEALSHDDELAGVAPRLMRPDGRTVDSVGQLLHPWTLEVLDRGYGRPIEPALLETKAVLAACGALAVFRRDALAAVSGPGGPWEEDFFCFWEDLELGWRLTNAGYRIAALPTAVATHGRGAGADDGRGPLRWRRSVQLEACIITNRWMTLLRHLDSLDLLRRLPLLLIWDLALLSVSSLRRPGLVAAIARRWPMVMREWRAREGRARRRLRQLPW